MPRRQRRGEPAVIHEHRFALALAGATLAIWLVAMVMISLTATGPLHGTATVLAVFRPGTASEHAFGAIVRSGGRPIGPTRLPFVWVVDVDRQGAQSLREAGALATFRELPFALQLGGCITAVPRRARHPVFSSVEPFR